MFRFEHLSTLFYIVSYGKINTILSPYVRWKYACKRDATQAGMKEDNATNRADWRNKLLSYTGDSDDWTSPGRRRCKMSY